MFKILFVIFPILAAAQTINEKEINQQFQTWVSLNSVTKFSPHWGIAADVHFRTNDFFQNTNFLFLRGGISYIPNSTFSFTGGYAHMWLAPKNPTWNSFSDENRIYQQIQMNTKFRNVSIVHRLRNEQRWQEIIINDQETGKNKFSNRVRYLISTNIPIFKIKSAPLLVISDELLLHFGNEIVYNTFDQNRFFIGIKQAINPVLSFDFGYMNVYQQKPNGYQYDMNHTLRLFFYLNSSFVTAHE